jgi:hypothetical protein
MYILGRHNNSIDRQIVYMATTQYFLKILRQHNFIIVRTISTFLMILNINNKTYVNFPNVSPTLHSNTYLT